MKHQENFTFTNWGKNIHTNARHFFQPETEEEIIQVIKQYPKIRMVGTGHSWSELCITDGVLLNLDHYNKVLALDKAKNALKCRPALRCIN